VRGAGVLDAAGAMATVAALGHGDGAGPVSPHVYWSAGTGDHHLTRHERRGQVSIVVPPAFQEVLEAIARQG
jgi:hypothetical protein